MNAVTSVDPKTFLTPRSLEEILSIVQFGSSVHISNPKDIDLCIVTKKDAFFDFLADEPFSAIPKNIDVSLVREEEINDLNSFRFGSHGVHLLCSLQDGVALCGENIFLKMPTPPVPLVKLSILDRLYDYHYEVRKLETSRKDVEYGLKKRWAKFQRLSLFLLDTTGEITFPAVLMIPDLVVKEQFAKYALEYQYEFTTVGFEHIWEKILVKNS
jgi:hypothetical protein